MEPLGTWSVRVTQHFGSNLEFGLAPKQPSRALLLISLKSTKPETKKLRWYWWGVQKSFQFHLKQLILSEVLKWEFEQVHTLSHSARWNEFMVASEWCVQVTGMPGSPSPHQ